jgi:hypothetical protein
VGFEHAGSGGVVQGGRCRGGSGVGGAVVVPRWAVSRWFRGGQNLAEDFAMFFVSFLFTC